MGLLADDDDQYIATVRVNELHGGKLGEDCSNSLEASKDLEETLWNLRNVYLSIDFDILLWDSLFACFLISKSSTPSNDDYKINHECCEKWNNNSPFLRSNRNQNSMLSLVTVLKFLDIPTEGISMNYLTLFPASKGMLCLQLNHPQTHDDLLQCLTNALLHFSFDLHTQLVAQRSLSVHDQTRLLNAAIHSLTELNQLQLQRSLPCFLVSRQDEE